MQRFCTLIFIIYSRKMLVTLQLEIILQIWIGVGPLFGGWPSFISSSITLNFYLLSKDQPLSILKWSRFLLGKVSIRTSEFTVCLFSYKTNLLADCPTLLCYKSRCLNSDQMLYSSWLEPLSILWLKTLWEAVSSQSIKITMVFEQSGATYLRLFI